MSSSFTLKEIENLVKQGEGQSLEFKKKANFPEKIVREMVAFANTDGGYLLVGVDDNGGIHGIKHADEDKYILDRSVVSLCKPRIKFTSRIIPVTEKKSLLLYIIYPSKKKPHYALSDKNERWGKAFIRLDDKSMQASREMIQIMKGHKFKSGQRIYYGEKEKTLLNYLEEKSDKITIDTYCEIANLPKKIASRTLVKLVLSNVLNVVPAEKGEYFVFNSQYSD